VVTKFNATLNSDSASNLKFTCFMFATRRTLFALLVVKARISLSDGSLSKAHLNYLSLEDKINELRRHSTYCLRSCAYDPQKGLLSKAFRYAINARYTINATKGIIQDVTEPRTRNWNAHPDPSSR
jgi:hypothetical protein